MLNRGRQAGDTLIEVLFAVTVLSLVIVSALSIMNQGSASSRRSLEMSLVSQQIDSQAEALRFLHESYVTNYQTGYSSTTGLTVNGPAGEYYKIVHALDDSSTQASAFGNVATCPAPPSSSFIINTRTGVAVTAATIFTPATTYSRLNFDPPTGTTLANAAGMWIEGISSRPSTDPSQANTGYIDFHIRACWDAPGQAQPIMLGTIVRLYEPRG